MTEKVPKYHREAKKKRKTCIIPLYLIWDQFLSPLPLLVSRQRNGTCQNKGSEIRLEQSWAGHLGGRLSISHSACCLLHSHSPLRNCVRKCNCVCACSSVCVCVCKTPHSLPHVTSILHGSTDASPLWGYATRAASTIDWQIYKLIKICVCARERVRVCVCARARLLWVPMGQGILPAPFQQPHPVWRGGKEKKNHYQQQQK